MSNYILVINPGSTSTKIGVFENDTLLFDKTLRHPPRRSQNLPPFPTRKAGARSWWSRPWPRTTLT